MRGRTWLISSIRNAKDSTDIQITFRLWGTSACHKYGTAGDHNIDGLDECHRKTSRSTFSSIVNFIRTPQDTFGSTVMFHLNGHRFCLPTVFSSDVKDSATMSQMVQPCSVILLIWMWKEQNSVVLLYVTGAMHNLFSLPGGEPEKRSDCPAGKRESNPHSGAVPGTVKEQGPCQRDHAHVKTAGFHECRVESIACTSA